MTPGRRGDGRAARSATSRHRATWGQSQESGKTSERSHVDSRYSGISQRVYWKKGMSMLPLHDWRCGAVVILLYPSSWYSLHCSVLLPRKLGYKEYLRIFSDILLHRKLGSKNILKYSPIFSYLASSDIKNILKYSPIYSYLAGSDIKNI